MAFQPARHSLRWVAKVGQGSNLQVALASLTLGDVIRLDLADPSPAVTDAERFDKNHLAVQASWSCYSPVLVWFRA